MTGKRPAIVLAVRPSVDPVAFTLDSGCVLLAAKLFFDAFLLDNPGYLEKTVTRLSAVILAAGSFSRMGRLIPPHPSAAVQFLFGDVQGLGGPS